MTRPNPFFNRPATPAPPATAWQVNAHRRKTDFTPPPLPTPHPAINPAPLGASSQLDLVWDAATGQFRFNPLLG
ncbi:MAG: hypothetical protein R2857_11425 [Vampirovibrionales bacterium]